MMLRSHLSHIRRQLRALLAVYVLFATAGLLAADKPTFQLDSLAASPRALEPLTAESIQRNYLLAWRQLAQALDGNHPELLVPNLAGSALAHFEQAVASQRSAGLSRRLVDHGHHFEVRFYSADGTSLEAIDSVDLETTYLDHGRTLASERRTTRFLVVLTPAQERWQLRVLQQLPPE